MRLERCHNIADLRRLARKRLPGPVFGYLDGGADDEASLRANSTAFDRYALVPRILVDVGEIDTTTTVLGQRLDWPLICAPTGMSRLFHHKGEIAVARAAAAEGMLYSLSTLATQSIEDVAAATGGPKMFQIYVQRDRALLTDLIARCRAAGYAALCLTVDVPVAGNRERDFYSGMTIPPDLSPAALLDIARHPRWLWHYLTSPRFRYANIQHLIEDEKGNLNSLVKYVAAMFDRSVTWKDAEWMIGQWSGPFAIKGILSVDDARRAADIGASAVIVSNHGGRQMDGVPAPVDVIADIADAVGDRIEVILDGGIRRGGHIIKALARGATACMAGRPYLYGLAAGGEPGVAKALAILHDEFARGMALMGARSVAELGPHMIRPAGRP